MFVLYLIRGNFGIIKDERKRFVVYFFYAFGVPLLMTVFVFALDKSDFVSDRFKAGLGEESCWFKSHNDLTTEMVYIYIPFAIVLTCNIVFFSITAYNIYQIQSQSSFNNGESNNRHGSSSDKYRFVILEVHSKKSFFQLH